MMIFIKNTVRNAVVVGSAIPINIHIIKHRYGENMTTMDPMHYKRIMEAIELDDDPSEIDIGEHEVLQKAARGEYPSWMKNLTTSWITPDWGTITIEFPRNAWMPFSGYWDHGLDINVICRCTKSTDYNERLVNDYIGDVAINMPDESTWPVDFHEDAAVLYLRYLPRWTKTITNLLVTKHGLPAESVSLTDPHVSEDLDGVQWISSSMQDYIDRTIGQDDLTIIHRALSNPDGNFLERFRAAMGAG